MSVVGNLIGSLRGKKESKKKEALPPVLAIKTQIKTESMRAFLEHLRANPSALAAYGATLVGHKLPSLEEQLWEEGLRTDPSLRAAWMKIQLEKRGMEGADWMQQFKKMKEFFGEEVGTRDDNRGMLAGLLGPETVAAGLAFLGKMMDQQRAVAPPTTPRVRRLPDVDVMDQFPTRVYHGDETQVGDTVEPVEPPVKVTPRRSYSPYDDNTVRYEEVGEDEADEEVTPPEAAVTSSGDPIKDYIDDLVHMLMDQEVTPEAAARVAIVKLEAVARIIQDIAPHRMDDVEKVHEMVTQSPDVIIFALGTMAMSSKEPSYVKAANYLKGREGRQYLARFCNERDVILADIEDEAAVNGNRA